MKKLFTLLFSTLLYLVSFSQSTTVVISQVSGGGGGSTGTYLFDYVELYNLSSTSQNISGFQLQYGSSTGTFASSASNNYTFPNNTIIEAGKYLLIQCGSTGTAGAALPVTPGLITTSLSMSGTSGKIALVNSSAAINTCGSTAAACTSIQLANFIDWVAYGAAGNGTAGNGEGGTSVNNGAAITSSQGSVRKNNGATDTDNNNADFNVVTAPVPRNTTILPITLKSISASIINNQPQINWQTSSEINANHFAIEKSINATDFASIGKVAATNANGGNYSFVDASKTISQQYYRLKLVDNDGSFKYSAVVAVNGKESAQLQVYPNPVVNTVILSHAKAVVGATITITAIDGRLLQANKVQVGATQTSLDVSKYVPSNYIVKYINNGVVSTSKFVK